MKVDRCAGQAETLQRRAVLHYNGPVKRESRFVAIPGDETLDSMLIGKRSLLAVLCRRDAAARGAAILPAG